MVDLTPFLVLVVLAVLVVIGARRIRLPYTVALVLLGFGIGLVGATSGFSPLGSGAALLLTPNLFFVLLLPPIIFEASLHVNLRLLSRRAGLILSLAFVGVLFLTFFAGTIVAYLAPLPFTAALLLVAILSPTDPVAIIDLFRRLRVPEGLATIVESESLLNDATGVILFVVVLQLIATGSTNVLAAAGQFAWLTLGGVAVGLLVAGAVFLLHRHLDDPPVEAALSIVTAYGSFLLADALGASGIVACMIAGISVGTWVAPNAIDPKTHHGVQEFWSVLVYVANSVIFLAMGVLSASVGLGNVVVLVLLVAAVMTLGRACFVYLHRPLSRPGRDRLPDSWYNVIAISGIRGAIPVVLALSLYSQPSGLPEGTVRTIVATVFGVALISIVAGNLVADWYVSRSFPTLPETPSGGAGPGSTGP